LRYFPRWVDAGRKRRGRQIEDFDVSVGAAIGLGALTGLVLGILISVTTDVPFAPEAGLVLGALAGWLSRRNG
jgi:hypothetical protein